MCCIADEEGKLLMLEECSGWDIGAGTSSMFQNLLFARWGTSLHNGTQWGPWEREREVPTRVPVVVSNIPMILAKQHIPELVAVAVSGTS